jgi:hypothetical protein
MDLGVSPDLDAYWCYGVVVLLGGWVGFRQVGRRLGGIAWIWLQPRTWLLFGAYLGVPLGLFWLLDRTGAVADTSLFAAALIGIGYERIITGQNSTVRAPGDVSSFWTPFLAYADDLERAVRQRTARDQGRLDERIVATVAASAQTYEPFLALVRARVADTAALDAQLRQLDQAAAGQGDGYLRERKSRLLYGMMIAVPDGYRLMYDRGIVGRRLYYLHISGGLMLLRAALPALLLVVAVGAAATRYIPTDPREVAESYYIWRAAKPSSSHLDQFRARRQLVSLVQDRAVAAAAVADLVSVLRQPDLPVDRVDLVLQILLEGDTGGCADASIGTQLIEALRTGNIDARSRINEALKYLAGARAAEPETTLWGWKPAEGDSTTALEASIARWQAYWRRVTEAHSSSGSDRRDGSQPGGIN